MRKYIDPYKVRAFFNYDPETGILTNAFGRCGAKRGDEAGSVSECGPKNSKKFYRKVMMDGEFAYTHRVIWVMMTGQQPIEIDHDDGNGLNNQWKNLKEGSHARNARNQKRHNTNTSGTAGVCYRAESGRWRARIMVDSVMISLGSFSDKEYAIKARKEAEVTYGFGVSP